MTINELELSNEPLPEGRTDIPDVDFGADQDWQWVNDSSPLPFGTTIH